VKNGPIGTIAPDTPIAEQDGATIVVADIDVHRTGNARRIWYEVSAVTSSKAPNDAGAPSQRVSRRPVGNQTEYRFTRGQGPDVELTIPQEALKHNPGNLVISLTFDGSFVITFRPKGADADWSAVHPGNVSQGNGYGGYYGMQQRTYDLSDWSSYVDQSTGKLSGALYCESGRTAEFVNVGITARMMADEQVYKGEDWKPWQ
jgi:hypothetical protein